MYITMTEPGDGGRRRFIGQSYSQPKASEEWCLDRIFYVVADPSAAESDVRGIFIEGLELDVLAIDEMPCFPSGTGNDYVVDFDS